MTRCTTVACTAALLAVAAVAPSSLPVRADPAFCTVLRQVQQASPSRFAEIGEVKGKGDFRTSGPVSVLLPGAASCEVVQLFANITYNCRTASAPLADAVALQLRYHELFLECHPKARVQGHSANHDGSAIEYTLAAAKGEAGPVFRATVTLKANREQKGHFTVNINIAPF